MNTRNLPTAKIPRKVQYCKELLRISKFRHIMKRLLILSIFIMSCSVSVESEYFQGSNEEYEIYLDIFFS